MYNRTNMRQPHGKNGWKRGSSNNSQAKKGRFSGDSININRFISKAEAVKPIAVFKPGYNFSDLTIHNALKHTISNRGLTTPTPIQDRAIPLILSGKDVIGIANTGTGKTAAFLIPLIHRMLADSQERALIVVPTRELALQIQEEFYRVFQKTEHFFRRGCGRRQHPPANYGFAAAPQCCLLEHREG